MQMTRFFSGPEFFNTSIFLNQNFKRTFFLAGLSVFIFKIFQLCFLFLSLAVILSPFSCRATALTTEHSGDTTSLWLQLALGKDSNRQAILEA